MPITELAGRGKIVIVTMNYLREALRLTGHRKVTTSYNSVINALDEKSKAHRKSTQPQTEIGTGN